MTELAIALLAVAVLLFIAEAHAPTTVLGLLGVGALVGAGFAWRDAGHDLPVAAIVIAGVILAGFIVFASRKALAAHRDELLQVLGEDSWLESKVSEGGTSLARVTEQLAAARAVLDERASG